MVKLIDLLKEAEDRLRAIRQDYELAMAKFQEGFALIARHLDVDKNLTLKNTELRLDSLGSRELEIFKLLGSGLKRSEIAKRCETSARTVGNQLITIRKKLGIENNWELQKVARTYMSDKKT